ncbi:Spc98 family-domain-containing protein [Hygrophoropsis aurantiaca]|uniref:Spc98 family-domain-containing protein n=1 Tax=Hygrophoropsis aurantiaca TaxID=72124 RepID=A0ACB8ATE6_9AGAM|nr:Spc98 family-domain-containing protein [Hygrophoropsis aurantiaca]
MSAPIPSGLHVRPSSRVSQRPSSSLSQHYPSSISTRPGSSASVRPQSRVSRPSSRISRPATRHALRLLPLSQALVTQITGLSSDNDDENFRTAVDYVAKNLEHSIKGGPSPDLTSVDKQMQGHIQKAQINSYDSLAEALKLSYNHLKGQAQDLKDIDQEIKLSRLPDHLQLLFLLSTPQEFTTHEYASSYLERIKNHPDAPSPLTWSDILAEEPFEGQHWEGVYGLPPGSTVEDWDNRSGGSTPSLSPWDDSDGSDDDDMPSTSSIELDEISTSVTENPPHFRARLSSAREAYSYRQDVEELESRQYWRPEWRMDVDVSRPFDLGEPSTLGPYLGKALGERETLTIDGFQHEKYIAEHDAVREILMCLQGRKNLMIQEENICIFVPSASAPRLAHFSLASQTSILSSFAREASTVAHLRKFTSAAFAKIIVPGDSTAHLSHVLSHNSRTRTLEAFADAVDAEIRAFDRWTAGVEEQICRAYAGLGDPLVLSLLSLEKNIRDSFSEIFEVLLDILQHVVQYASQSSGAPAWTLLGLPSRISPAVVTGFLLDALLERGQKQSSMCDSVTSQALLRVLIITTEPIWRMVGQWLKDGMPLRDSWGSMEAHTFDEEFFIEDNELPLLDPDFWSDGYVLRKASDVHSGDIDRKRVYAVPIFLESLAETILGTGKSIGLLRALGVHSFQERNNVVHGFPWRSFGDLLQQYSGMFIDTDNLVHLVTDEISAYCTATGIEMTQVLTTDCDLSRHMDAMESLYLMMRGDVISHFTDILFAKIDSQQKWDDFHFLNSAFADVLESSASKWIDASLVRLSYRGNGAVTINRTVKALSGLSVEYAMPFPLTYIFSPRVLQIYSSIFVFLLQIRRAKNVLERILVRGSIVNTPHLGEGMKVFYAMRGKLSWFINTLLNFLSTYVIHTQVLRFHDAFREAKSLDEMIKVHDNHLEKVQNRCLLQPHTSALHRAILSILDMCLHFSTFFVSFAGDTTHDISRLSINMKRHRSRRQRRKRKNVIGFSQSLLESQSDGDDTDSDDDPDYENRLQDMIEPSYSVNVSYAGEDFAGSLEKLSLELDNLVRFIRRGIESFAGGTSEAASAFGVLAFALEDWDS